MPDIRDRFLGCLLGLATGDAVGTTLEFKPPGTFTPITDMIGGGPFLLKAGQWTDDTSMALCLAESLVEKGDFDPRDQMERYSLWEATGYMSSNGLCFDIGNTVQRALSLYRFHDRPMAGSTDPSSAGNGSLMRLAPVPMFYATDAELAIRYAVESSRTTHGALTCLDACRYYSGLESSRTTHGALTCLDACRYYSGLIWAALNGTPREELLSPNFSPIHGLFDAEPLCAEIAAIASGSFKRKNPPQIRGTGYVVHSLEAAMWALNHSSDFRTGCLLAANLGDDADTTAAIFGQLAGAVYGKENIPPEWLDRLALRQTIETLAIRLCPSVV